MKNLCLVFFWSLIVFSTANIAKAEDCQKLTKVCKDHHQISSDICANPEASARKCHSASFIATSSCQRAESCHAQESLEITELINFLNWISGD